ncbi:hypothetical protein D3C87_1176670 [compost metagenome]
MKWHEAGCEQDLKSIGEFETVLNLVSEDLGEKISLSVTNWDELLSAVKILKNLFNEASQKNKEGSYFKTELDHLIFSLTELDGKDRQKQLNIGPLHYKNNELAKKWRKSLANKLHEDRCKHPKAKEAWHKMEEIYKEMLGK